MSLRLLTSLEQIPLDPIIALIGPESYLRRRLRQGLAERALAGALKDMNFSQFQAGEDDLSRVLDACRDYPCFAARRVVVLRDAGNLKAKDAEPLLTYLQDPQPTTLFLVESEKLDGRTEWVKALKKRAHWLDVELCESAELQTWVRDCFRQEGKRAASEVVDRTIDWVGNSLEALQLTVSQCCLFAGDAAEVTLRDLETLLVKVTDENIFEVIDALFARRHAELHRSLEALLATGEEPLRILSLIHRHISILLSLRFSGPRKAGENFRMPPMAWKKYEQQAQRFGSKLTLSLWAPLTRADLRLKGSALPRPLILKRSVDEILRLLA